MNVGDVLDLVPWTNTGGSCYMPLAFESEGNLKIIHSQRHSPMQQIKLWYLLPSYHAYRGRRSREGAGVAGVSPRGGGGDKGSGNSRLRQMSEFAMETRAGGRALRR